MVQQSSSVSTFGQVLKMSTRDNLISYFRKELINQRLELNISQEEMAEFLNITLRSYSDLENGKSFCSIYTFIIFAYKCNIDKAELLTALGEIMINSED